MVSSKDIAQEVQEVLEPFDCRVVEFPCAIWGEVQDFLGIGCGAEIDKQVVCLVPDKVAIVDQ